MKKLGIDYTWQCEDKECGWVGDYPKILSSFEFLGLSKDELDKGYEIEYIEVCPICGKQALYKFY